MGNHQFFGNSENLSLFQNGTHWIDLYFILEKIMESPVFASMRWLLNEQYRRVRKLEEENETLKEENEKLKKSKICWKTVEERIEIDEGVVRDED